MYIFLDIRYANNYCRGKLLSARLFNSDNIFSSFTI